MAEKNKYRIINIRQYIGNENPELGEDELLQILSEFSCPLNPDVERFLKHSSIEFTKKNQSVTYLVFSAVGGRLLGYFTLALKPLTVRGETVSNTVKRKLLRISELDQKSDTYTMSAYLIPASNEPSAVLARAFGECREGQQPRCLQRGC